MANTGSFGLHVDSQLDSLRRIREAKEFAKAVKADDAKVPVHLWNNRLPCPSEDDQRDKALDTFRGWWWRKGYMQGLRRDCFHYMCEEHGSEWTTLERGKEGRMTEVG